MIKIKTYLILGLLVLSAFVVNAQQDPLFTQYMNNPGLINPAYAGSKGNLNINGIFRKQWIGQDWSPMTTSISVNSPFMNNFDVGLGFTLIDDKIGPQRQTGIYIDYARYLRFSQNRNLALGLKAGFNYFDINLLNLITQEYDHYITANPRKSKALPNFGVGAYYFTDKYYIGISIPKLIRNSLNDEDNTLTLIGREERHYYLTAGYLFVIDDPVWKLKPSLMTRIVNGAPGSFELSLTAIFYDKIWFGLAYRFGDALAGHIRFQANDRLQIGYSYDLNNSRLRYYNSGSHEIYLSYDFSFRGRRILSPRYF